LQQRTPTEQPATQRPDDSRNQRRAPTQQQQQQRAPLLLGKSTAGCSISAAERRRTKVVLCVDNVTPTCTVEDMSSFITGLSVHVVSCFEAKTRRRRNDRPAVGTVSRKAFL